MRDRFVHIPVHDSTRHNDEDENTCVFRCSKYKYRIGKNGEICYTVINVKRINTANIIMFLDKVGRRGFFSYVILDYSHSEKLASYSRKLMNKV